MYYVVNSPVSMEKILYKVKPDGVADVWLRKNEKLIPATEEMQESYEADEVFCRVDSTVISENEILADFDFWFSMLSQLPEEFDANELGIKARREAKILEISSVCEKIITDGIDVKIGDEVQHFSLAIHDQINLFGKQAQITAGAKQCEYHQDGNPCKFYTAEEMSTIITAAMEHVSMQQTYCNSVYDWIKSCELASQIEAIQYGDEVPDEYQSVVLKEYLKKGSE